MLSGINMMYLRICQELTPISYHEHEKGSSEDEAVCWASNSCGTILLGQLGP